MDIHQAKRAEARAAAMTPLQRLFAFLDWFIPKVDPHYALTARILVFGCFMMMLHQGLIYVADIKHTWPFFMVSIIALCILRLGVIQGRGYYVLIFVYFLQGVLSAHRKYSLQFPDLNAFQSFSRVRICKHTQRAVY
jgi:hypothetical protein